MGDDVRMVDGRTGLPMVCHVCGKPTGLLESVSDDRPGTAEANMRPVCVEHSLWLTFATISPPPTPDPVPPPAPRPQAGERLESAVADFLAYTGAGKPYPWDRIGLLLAEQQAKCRNQDDRDYWRFVRNKLNTVVAALAAVRPGGEG